MRSVFLVDTGPLVAFLNRRDRFHGWAKKALAGASPPLLTCESVISEACFLLRNVIGGRQAVLDLVVRQLLKVDFRLDLEVEPVRKLIAKYADVPMSLADACLVRMAELEPRAKVITLDSDFERYRRLGRQVIELVCA